MTILAQFLFIFIARDRLIGIPSSLSVRSNFVIFDSVSIFSLPFAARVSQVFLPPRLAVFLPLNLLLPVFSLLALENLATSDVQLATCYRGQEPLVNLAKSNMVLFDIFSIDSLNDSLTVVQCLVGQKLSALRLLVHLVVHHGLRDLVIFDHSDPFPVQFVGLW